MIKSLAPFLGKKVFVQLKNGNQFLGLHAQGGLPAPLMKKQKGPKGEEVVSLQPFPFIAAEVVEYKGEIALKIPDEAGNTGTSMLILPDFDTMEFVTAMSDDPPDPKLIRSSLIKMPE
jgi:hypothetical protein